MDIVKPKGTISKEEYLKLSREDRLKYWKISNGDFIEIKEMSDAHLQKAFFYAQNKELIHHNNYALFADLVEEIEKESKSRGKTLKDINTQYHKNKREYAEKRDPTLIKQDK